MTYWFVNYLIKKNFGASGKQSRNSILVDIIAVIVDSTTTSTMNAIESLTQCFL